MSTLRNPAPNPVGIKAALAEVFEVPVEEVNQQSSIFSVEGRSFFVEWSPSAAALSVSASAERAAEGAKAHSRRTIPLVALPFMNEAGRRAGEAGRASWLDLSGNAHIVAPGIRVVVDGRANRFRSPGRPANLFAPKSARVVRWLLIHPATAFSQREIARATGMTEGFVSRIVARLEQQHFIVRESRGALRARDPAALLEAWREAYQFSKHRLIKGHVAARSGDALMRFVSDVMVEATLEHAATGLAAAWQLTRLAGFRLATFYFAASPSAELLKRLGFRAEVRGANLWLAVPNDAGVFHGAAEYDGIRCVHPAQVYLDLKEHPERAAEAAEDIRRKLLS